MAEHFSKKNKEQLENARDLFNNITLLRDDISLDYLEQPTVDSKQRLAYAVLLTTILKKIQYVIDTLEHGDSMLK